MTVQNQYTWIIDTSASSVRMGLFKGLNLIDALEWEAGRELGKTFFPNLERLLQKNRIGLANIEDIIVVMGPGGFTGLRIGISIANAFAFALGVPIRGIVQKERLTLEEIYSAKKNLVEGLVTPFYDREPNITKKKVLD